MLPNLLIYASERLPSVPPYSAATRRLGFWPELLDVGDGALQERIERLAHIGEYAGLTALLHRALREQGSRRARKISPLHLPTSPPLH